MSEDQVAEVLAFVRVAKRAGQADPSAVDEHLRRGSAAFLRKAYSAAHRILGAILPPIGDGEIDLGQRELVDDVLGADVGECAAQYVVSAYRIALVAERAAAVYTAIESVRGVGRFWEPLREMERVAVEGLPDLRDFLPEWRALIANKPTGKRISDWDTEEDQWLREVVQRLEGPAGLEKVARSTRRADDLRAWCKSLVDAGDWKTVQCRRRAGTDHRERPGRPADARRLARTARERVVVEAGVLRRSKPLAIGARGRGIPALWSKQIRPARTSRRRLHQIAEALARQLVRVLLRRRRGK